MGDDQLISLPSYGCVVIMCCRNKKLNKHHCSNIIISVFKGLLNLKVYIICQKQ